MFRSRFLLTTYLQEGEVMGGRKDRVERSRERSRVRAPGWKNTLERQVRLERPPFVLSKQKFLPIPWGYSPRPPRQLDPAALPRSEEPVPHVRSDHIAGLRLDQEARPLSEMLADKLMELDLMQRVRGGDTSCHRMSERDGERDLA